MVDDIKVNLSSKKTEAGWMEAQNKFFLNFTPIWFNWLEWVIIIGAVQVISEKTDDLRVRLILGLSYNLLIFYMIGFFYRIEFYGIPFIKSEKKRLIVSIMLSSLLALGVFNLLSHLATQLN